MKKIKKEITAHSLFTKGVSEVTASKINRGVFKLDGRCATAIQRNIGNLKDFYLKKRSTEGRSTVFIDGVLNLEELCDVSSFFHLNKQGKLQIKDLKGKIIYSFDIATQDEEAAQFIKKYAENYIRDNVSAYFLNHIKEKVFPFYVKNIS